MNLIEEVIGFTVLPLKPSKDSLCILCSCLTIQSGWPGDSHLGLYRDLDKLSAEIESKISTVAPVAITVVDPVRFWLTAIYDRQSLSELKYNWDWPLENRPMNSNIQSEWCRLGYMVGDSLFGGSSIGETVSLAGDQGLILEKNLAISLLEIAEQNDPDWDKHVFGVYSVSPGLLNMSTKLTTLF